MSYLRYLCLFAHNDVQHILCSVFVLFVFVLCSLCYLFLWIVHFWLPLRYSLTFIYNFSGLSICDCPSVFSNVYLSVFLDCPLLIAPSVSSNVYSTVLTTQIIGSHMYCVFKWKSLIIKFENYHIRFISIIIRWAVGSRYVVQFNFTIMNSFNKMLMDNWNEIHTIYKSQFIFGSN